MVDGNWVNGRKDDWLGRGWMMDEKARSTGVSKYRGTGNDTARDVEAQTAASG